MSGQVFQKSACCILVMWCAVVVTAMAQAAPTPTETVQRFYRALHEKKFREAFALSIYRGAVDPLTDAELSELSPDFERIAAAIPPNFIVSGEQISGETATVFVRISQGEEAPLEPVTLMRAPEGWIIGDKENQKVVKKSGKEFFFKARIETHHVEVEDMLQRIFTTQTVYSAQHGGQFADLAKLIEVGYLPKDLEGTETTGYRFQIVLSPDKKGYTVTAEPASYGRSGRLSYWMDQTGVPKSKDVKGKALRE